MIVIDVMFDIFMYMWVIELCYVNIYLLDNRFEANHTGNSYREASHGKIISVKYLSKLIEEI